MAKNQVFRVYDDEETMLKVYNRRNRMADTDFEKREPEYRTYISRYQNEPTEDQVTDDAHRVNVTNGIGVIDTMFSSLTAVEVEAIARRVGRGTEAQAIAATKALNQAARDTKLQRRAKRAIKDALLVDIGFVKVYYDYVEDVELKDRPAIAIQAEVAELKGRNQDLDEASFRALVAKEVSATEDVVVVLRDRVCVDYVSWEDIRYDISAKQVEDVRWWTQYTKYPLEEVRLHPEWRMFVFQRYGETEGKRLLDDLEGDSLVTSGMDYTDVEGLGSDSSVTDDDGRVTVCETWDMETGLVTIYPKNHDGLVLYQRPNPLMFNLDLDDRSPFKPLIIRHDPDNLEGLGDMRVILPSLEELDEYRSNIANHVARSIPKVFGPKDALGQQGRKALESDEFMAYVGLEQGHDYRELGSPPIPALTSEVYGLTDKIQLEIQETTGANEVVRGVFPSKRTTATEANLVTTQGQARQAERRSAVEEWYKDIYGTMLQLMQKFYDKERMMRFVADTGEDFEWKWTNEDIAVEADIEIAITPMESLTREERFQRAVFVANMLLPLPESDRASIMQWVLREAGLDEDLIRTMVKTPEEVQQEQMAQNAQANLFAVGAQKAAAYGSLYGGGPKRG